ncbi:MAG: hypothetical protein LUQ09_05845 [Methanomassiliicoccales archaeon]|nr:hypothetical protein [Methanomassiliicoccales archaeon]
MKVLFYSGSLGMGHVNRDLAIASELRKARNDLDIIWVAGEPALTRLREVREKVVTSSEDLQKESEVLENVSNGFDSDMYSYLVQWDKNWQGSYRKFLKILAEVEPDLIIGDEAYEVITGFAKWPGDKHWPLAMLYDFPMFQSITGSVRERFICYMGNRYWNRGFKVRSSSDLSIFLGEKEEIPDVKYGPFRYNVRKVAWERWKFVGNAIPFDPTQYADRAKVRKELGYPEDEVLIIGAVGGTNVGKPMLELFGNAYPLLKARLPNLHMVLVCGPRIDPGTVKVPDGVEVRGYVPDLFKHLAACDLCLTQGGGGTTMELTALRKPFIYFPLEKHLEQQIYVSKKLELMHAGTKMVASQTSPTQLAEAVMKELNRQVDYRTSGMNGVKGAAEEILGLMNKISAAE